MIQLLTVLLLTSAVHGGWRTEIARYSAGKSSTFTPEQLEYKMSWNGAIRSGKITIEFGQKDKRYPNVFLSHAYGRSTGPAFVIFPYTFTFTSFAKLSDHRPLVFVATEKDNKEVVDTRNSYKSSGVHCNATTTLHASKTVISHSHLFTAKAIHDPLSAILAIRKQPLYKGSVIQLCCHPFASPYLIKVTVLERAKHLGYDCIKLDVKIQKIDKKTGKLLVYKKLKKATMWITDDGQRIPVELRSKVLIGDVRATLTKRSPL